MKFILQKQKGYFMDNHDILKFKTFHNYNFDDIESNEFLALFYKFLDLNKEKSNELQIESMIFESKSDDNNSNDSKIDLDKETENNEEKKYECPLSMYEIEKQFHTQITNILPLDILPFIQKNHNSFELIEKKLRENENFLRELVKRIQKIVPTGDYNGQPFYSYSKFSLNLTIDLFPICNTQNSKDHGNCLYNTFSLLYFGDEIFYYIIKICSIFMIIENKDFFQHVLKTLKYEINFERLIKNSCKEKEWGNELNILSISLLINRKICLYNVSTPTDIERFAGNSISAYNNRIIFSIDNDLEQVLMGQDGPHFFPILKDKRIHPDVKKINRDQIFFSTSYS